MSFTSPDGEYSVYYTPLSAITLIALPQGVPIQCVGAFLHQIKLCPDAICACVQGALRAADIVPSKDEVSTSDFLAALTQKFGYEPILFCDEDRSGNKYIDSV